MKNLFFIMILLLHCAFVKAQTIYTNQDTTATSNFGQVIPAGTAIDGNIDWTGWSIVNTKRTICYDIDIIDANTSVTSFDMFCETSRSIATVAGQGNTIPVFTSTASTGITLSTSSKIRQVSPAGTGPGTSKWTWCVTNIPGPFIECGFQGNGVFGAADTFGVFARGITP